MAADDREEADPTLEGSLLPFSLPPSSSVASDQLPSPALGGLSWAVTVSPAWKPRLRYLKKGDFDGEGASAIDGMPDRSESISDAT